MPVAPSMVHLLRVGVDSTVESHPTQNALNCRRVSKPGAIGVGNGLVVMSTSGPSFHQMFTKRALKLAKASGIRTS